MKYVLKLEITIITSSEKVSQVCVVLDICVIKHKAFSHLEYLICRKKVINEIRKVISIVDNNNFHFSHTQYSIFLFLLYEEFRLVHKKLIFHDFELVFAPVVSLKETLLFTRQYLTKTILSELYVPNLLEIRKDSNNRGVISMKLEPILNQTMVVRYNENDYYNLLSKMYLEYKSESSSVKYLFIAQDIDYSEYNNSLNLILNELEILFNTLGFMKRTHPAFQNVSAFSRIEEITFPLPVEFYLNKVTKAVVSFSSYSLITASIMSHVKAISLIKLLPNYDPQSDFIIKDLKMKSNNRILFPKTIDELKFILD